MVEKKSSFEERLDFLEKELLKQKVMDQSLLNYLNKLSILNPSHNLQEGVYLKINLQKCISNLE